jgi:ankyrin repeat protein
LYAVPNGPLSLQNGWSPIHIASGFGHEKVLSLLLQKGADINFKNNKGSSALIAAATGGKDNVVALLIKNKADLNVQDDVRPSL